MSPKFSGFKDPIGLVKRMILSGNDAARAALCREVLGLICTPVSWLLQPLEKVDSQAIPPRSNPILLIVGPPRSGSSLIYQTLAHYLPVCYFNNLSALFPYTPVMIERFSRSFSPPSSLNFRNYYGQTTGLMSPNDGFHIWNRWLGDDRYSVPEQLSHNTKKDMQRFFSAWAAVKQKPLLNKNNRNTAAIELLDDTLDNVYWIIVERDPLYIAQSLLIAREAIQGDRRVGWGLYSQDCISSESAIQTVVEQVHQIFVRIRHQTQTLDSQRFIRVPYEEFCLKPNYFVQEIYSRVWASEYELEPHHTQIRPFTCQNKMKLPVSEFNELKALIHQSFATMSD